MWSSKGFAGSGLGLHHIVNRGLIEGRWCGLRGEATTSYSSNWSVEPMRKRCACSTYLTLAELTFSLVGTRGAFLIFVGDSCLGLDTGGLTKGFLSCGCGGFFSIDKTVLATFAGGSEVEVVLVVFVSAIKGVDKPFWAAFAGGSPEGGII